jgi:hypothetical protein
MAKTTFTLDEERPVRMRATPARQGFLDKDILAVLVVSTLLAMVVLFAALAIQSSTLNLDREGPQTRLTAPAAGEMMTSPSVNTGQR